MKAPRVLMVVALLALGGIAGWWASRLAQPQSASTPGDVRGGAKIYSCSMHPHVRMAKAGACPICGMALAPLAGGNAANVPGTLMLSTNRINAIHVQTEPVRRRPFERGLRVSGLVEYNDKGLRRLVAGVDGRIEALHVSVVGTEVTEGQRLATISSPAVQAAVREYQTLMRIIIPVYMPPEAQEDQLRKRINAKQTLLRYGLLERQITALTNDTRANFTFDLLAPISGTVISRDAVEGQFIKEGDRLFEIVDLYAMWFSFDVYEQDLPWIRVGQMVDITTAAVPGRVFTFPITVIDPNINNPTRSAKVRVAVPNPRLQSKGVVRRDFYHKLFAEGVVKVESTDVLAMPRQAVLNTGARVVCYVDMGAGRYEQRALKLGRRADDFWEVLDGVKEGELVVTAGNMLLDSQAQLSNGEVSSSPTTNASADGKLSESRLAAAQELFMLADAVARPLAADNLAEFNQQSSRLRGALPALMAEFAGNAAWQPWLRKVELSSQGLGANDLKSARRTFHPFSTVVVEFALAVRAQSGEFAAIKIYECPMSAMSFPGAPPHARWLQLQPPMRNPYFGAQMLDCGNEVKP